MDESMPTSTDCGSNNGTTVTPAGICITFSHTSQTSEHDHSGLERRKCLHTDFASRPMPSEQLSTPDRASRHRRVCCLHATRDSHSLPDGMSSKRNRNESTENLPGQKTPNRPADRTVHQFSATFAHYILDRRL